VQILINAEPFVALRSYPFNGYATLSLFQLKIDMNHIVDFCISLVYFNLTLLKIAGFIQPCGINTSNFSYSQNS
jgi:hypothetical protein